MTSLVTECQKGLDANSSPLKKSFDDLSVYDREVNKKSERNARNSFLNDPGRSLSIRTLKDLRKSAEFIVPR